MKFNFLIITILLFVSFHAVAKDMDFGNATVLEITSIQPYLLNIVKTH